MLPLSPLALSLGAAGWTLTEYCMHRFAGHGPHRRPPRGLARLTPTGIAAAFNTEHVHHHADPTYFAPTRLKLMAAAVMVPVIGAAASAVAGPRRGLSFALGYSGAYLGYEVMHRRVHTHAPINGYDRWMKRHHLHHHVNPRVDHGVTLPSWDHVFGTYVEPPARVRLPRKLAPAWMLDAETGELLARFEEDYELTGAAPGGNGATPQPASA